MLGQLAGLPPEAHDALREKLIDVSMVPDDPVASDPTEVPGRRWALLGGNGFVEFQIWDDLATIVVLDVTWVG